MEKYNLVPRLKKSIEYTIELINKHKHKKINSSHLLYSLIENSTSQIKLIFSNFNINTDILKAALMTELPNLHPEKYEKVNKNEDWWAQDIEDLLEASHNLSQELSQEFIGVEHVLHSILTSKSFTRDYLMSKEVPVEQLAQTILSTLNPFESDDFSSKNKEKAENVNEEGEEKNKFCAKYCHNLNDLVKKFSSKVEGRDPEIDKLVEILSCKVKNNAILVGDAGVGKTAIVEGLAQRMNSYSCPVFFAGYKIYSLDLGLMLAGTKYRGQFEERFKGLLEELKKDSQAILFIDEIHSIVGAGSSEGALDLANMIKPALARGEIKCIGATTQMEYKKYFEKDSALNRRFQLLNIDEPSKVQTFEIVKKAKENYEKFHGVTYEDSIINDIINLSEKYLPYRKFPDKAFDILDRVGASGKIQKFKVPEKLKKTEEKVIKTLNESNLESEEEKAKCEKMMKSFLQKRELWIKKTDSIFTKISEDDILCAFSKVTGMQKDKIKLNSPETICNLKEEMESKIFDQPEALEKIYNVLLCSKAGIKSSKKTLANFLFVGSTGVGKTYAAKIIAEKFFNKPNSFLQIDMAEYVDKNSISKLIGTSAGYVGYDEGGLLSEFVRNNPSSLILFDEVEKAHPDIVNILLKIMDEGVIIDNFNRKIDFTNTIIVLTGNIGAEFETQKTMGFSEAREQENRSSEYLKSVKKFFKPELISRLDEVLIFNNKFSKEGLLKMMSASLSEIEKALLEKNIKLNVDNEIKNYLYSLIEKEGSNARSVYKVLKNTFELPLCKFIVSHQNLCKISSKIVDNKISFI